MDDDISVQLRTRCRVQGCAHRNNAHAGWQHILGVWPDGSADVGADTSLGQSMLTDMQACAQESYVKLHNVPRQGPHTSCNVQYKRVVDRSETGSTSGGFVNACLGDAAQETMYHAYNEAPEKQTYMVSTCYALHSQR